MTPNSNPTDQFNSLQEIVDFAVEKEREAVAFYTDLAQRIKSKTLSEELLKIAGMESEHERRLKSMDVTSAASHAAKQVLNLKIADYLVAPVPQPQMTWQDILNIAMHRELAAMKMYTDLAGATVDSTAIQLFKNLAAEEAGHKLYFERVYDEEILIEN